VIPECFWIDEYPIRNLEWLVDGVISPHINILSGQPKVGKSTLATSIALSIINGEPVLGRKVNVTGPVGWIGYDSGWDEELRTRSSGRGNNQILMQKPFDLTREEDSHLFGNRLRENNCQLLVIDHLYGFANNHNFDINNQLDAAKAMRGLQIINSEYEVPVLLLAQATKGHSGGVAHSNFIKGLARVLLEMTGVRKDGLRTLRVIGNELETKDLKLRLSDGSLTSLGESDSVSKKRNREFSIMVERARCALSQASLEDIANVSSMGRLFHRLRFSNTVGSSRTMVNRYINFGILTKGPQGITLGPNCDI
jgi:hypothetical protein